MVYFAHTYICLVKHPDIIKLALAVHISRYTSVQIVYGAIYHVYGTKHCAFICLGIVVFTLLT